MQFVIVGRDGSDEQALARRLACRAEHLQACKEMKEAGTMLFGAALFGEAGNMNGSLIVLDLPTRDDVDRYLEQEPYVRGNVWQNIEITPCAVGAFFLPQSKTQV